MSVRPESSPGVRTPCGERRTLLCVFALAMIGALSGCHGYLVEGARRPIPSDGVATRGGGFLRARDGNLVVSGPDRALGTLIGALFREDGGGDGVEIVDIDPAGPAAAAELQAGDRVVSVTPRLPDLGAQAAESDSVTAPRQEIARVADLDAYCAGKGWLTLEFEVERNGSPARASIPVPVHGPEQPVPVERADPRQIFRRAGFEVVVLDGWPEEFLPVHGEPGALLVTRVEEDSPAAIAGLRPLDVVFADLHQFALVGAARVRRADGRERTVTLGAVPHRSSSWFPLIYSREVDASRTHIGIGPFDWLYHYSSRRLRDPRSDRVSELRKWSVLTLFQGVEMRAPGGVRRYRALDPIIDTPRMMYGAERLAGDTEVDFPTRWPARVDLEEE